MSVVELYRRRPDTAETELLARIVVTERGGPAVMIPAVPDDRAGIEAILAQGVADASGRLVDPHDGEAYLNGLVETFRGSRFWAERIEGDARSPDDE
ncbi:MAG TPA: hypothetical protein VFV72_07325 [Candidatus Limnocylindrales bacterium]|nr:hypothetical protein [Candidatus Limnocylindrales bacterium]